jgi:hypothetical protein
MRESYISPITSTGVDIPRTDLQNGRFPSIIDEYVMGYPPRDENTARAAVAHMNPFLRAERLVISPEQIEVRSLDPVTAKIVNDIVRVAYGRRYSPRGTYHPELSKETGIPDPAQEVFIADHPVLVGGETEQGLLSTMKVSYDKDDIPRLFNADMPDEYAVLTRWAMSEIFTIISRVPGYKQIAKELKSIAGKRVWDVACNTAASKELPIYCIQAGNVASFVASNGIAEMEQVESTELDSPLRQFLNNTFPHYWDPENPADRPQLYRVTSW